METKERIIKRVYALFLAFVLTVAFYPAIDSEAASSTREQFRQELRQMIYSVDESLHDVYKYKLTASEANTIFQEIKNSDSDKWMVAAYYSNMYMDYTKSGSYVKDIRLVNVDTNVSARYKNLSANVAKIKAGIEPKMTDLDKLIYLHDSIVELASYKYVAYQSYGACGVLGDKTGVCAGYTKALNLLLSDQNIYAVYMTSDAIDHGWTAVYLDDQWYHVDSTWDDTRSGKSGVTGHQFMLRNDSEFVTNDKNSHVSWEMWNCPVTYESTSTRFANWYVHDIVGKIAFEDGYWYYVDTKTNSIMQNTTEGRKAKVILDGSKRGTITLLDARPDGIVYKENGVEKTVGYEGEQTPANEPKKELEKSESPKEEFVGIDVDVYIMKTGTSKYISMGKGQIKEAKTSKDSKVIDTLIYKLPSIKWFVSDNQYVVWTSLTKSGGKYYLKGTAYNR